MGNALSPVILKLAAVAARRLPVSVKRGFYRFPPFARLIRSMLNRSAPRGLTRVEIAAGGLQGIPMLLDMQAEKDYWLGTYEPELQTAIAELVQPGMVAYDVGANVGYISLLLARAAGPGGQVFAFEALPENIERLQANLALSEPGQRVSVIYAAVVDQTRPVRFFIGPSDDMGKAEGSAGREGVTYAAAVEVPGLSLDDFVFTQGHTAPQVLKMDIEGGEVLALPGMERLLQEAHPVLLLELHGGESAQAAWKILKRCGYRICRMAPGYPEVPSLEALDWKAYLAAFPGIASR